MHWLIDWLERKSTEIKWKPCIDWLIDWLEQKSIETNWKPCIDWLIEGKSNLKKAQRDHKRIIKKTTQNRYAAGVRHTMRAFVVDGAVESDALVIFQPMAWLARKTMWGIETLRAFGRANTARHRVIQRKEAVGTRQEALRVMEKISGKTAAAIVESRSMTRGTGQMAVHGGVDQCRFRGGDWGAGPVGGRWDFGLSRERVRGRAVHHEGPRGQMAVVGVGNLPVDGFILNLHSPYAGGVFTPRLYAHKGP